MSYSLPDGYLVFGFLVTLGDLMGPFQHNQEETYHMEDRFSEKTGQKLSPIKVVDQKACEGWKVGDLITDEPADAFYALLEHLNIGGRFRLNHEHLQFDEMEEEFIVSVFEDTGSDNSFSLTDLTDPKNDAEIARVRKVLGDLGAMIEEQQPMIYACVSA